MNNKKRYEIELLSKNYIESKRKLREYDDNVVRYSTNKVKAYRRIVSHIEEVVRMLPDKERIIIENEVIYGQTGTWYLEYFSSSSYYRHRKVAYSNFLNCL